jgi:hypothetical protein
MAAMTLFGPARQHFRADGTPKVGCADKRAAKRIRRSVLALGLPCPHLYRCPACWRWHFATRRNAA